MTAKNNCGLEVWLGESLRRRRVIADLSRQQLSDALEVRHGVVACVSSVALWERCKREPHPNEVEALADILGCRPFDFAWVPGLEDGYAHWARCAGACGHRRVDGLLGHPEGAGGDRGRHGAFMGETLL